MTPLLKLLSFQLKDIATCALFLAAKVEEDPRKLEHVIRVSHACLNRDNPHLDTHSEVHTPTCSV